VDCWFKNEKSSRTTTEFGGIFLKQFSDTIKSVGKNRDGEVESKSLESLDCMKTDVSKNCKSNKTIFFYLISLFNYT